MYEPLKRPVENDNSDEISILDVKEVYDAAYAEKDKARASIKRFQRLMVKAAALEAAYRAQLDQDEQNKYRRAA